MSRHFSAVVLLERPVGVDIDALAQMVMEHFPTIGPVEPVMGQQGPGSSGLLRIEGGHIVVTVTPNPYPDDKLFPRLQLLRSWDPVSAIASHEAYLTISCGGGLSGVDGAEAYAAAVHFVAGAATRLMSATAVFWQRGFVLSDPVDFYDSSKTLLKGRMPVGAWISFASVVPKGYAPTSALGMVTYGMRQFIGREIELAPRPGNARAAYNCLVAVVRNTLDKGEALADGQRFLTAGASSLPLTVRERTFWLRRDQSAFVLVSDDSVVDMDTLRPRERPAA
ncbi:MAG: hypothetical protein AB8B85_19925 [Paracoccaceae bacterium]